MISAYEDSPQTTGTGAAQRIISLVPSTTEMLYYLGLQDRVTGVTDHCDFPEEAKKKHKVGTFAQPRLAEIISLKPDLVLADSALHRKATEELAGAGIKVLAHSPSSVEDVLFMMSEIGRACDIESDAGPLIESLRERVRGLNLKPEDKRPRVFQLMSTHPFITPGPGSFLYDALRLAGARLMNFKTQDAYARVTFDQIKEFNPEVILFCGVAEGQAPPPRCKGCHAVKPACQRTAGDIFTVDWDQIEAVRVKRLHPIPCHTICRPGPRMIEGMELLYKSCLN